jgi:hypothetical protein
MNIKLLGSKITKFSGYKDPLFSGQFKLETNINLKSIELNLNDKKYDSLKVFANYSINYEKLGKIEIEGILFLNGDKKDLKLLLDLFNKKKYNTPEMVNLMNLIMQKFSIKAFEIEEELGLPIHLKLPSLQTKK